MRTFLKILSWFYFIFLIYVFFLAWRRPSPTLHPHHRTLRLLPIYDKLTCFGNTSFGSLHEIKQTIALYLDFFGNILLFVPIALILSIVFSIKSKAKIILIAFLTSLSVEAIQYTFGIGVADIDDLILNTVGACLGLLLLKYMHRSTHPFVNSLLYAS